MKETLCLLRAESFSIAGETGILGCVFPGLLPMLNLLFGLRSRFKAQLLSYTQAQLLLLESRLNRLPQNNEATGSPEINLTFDCYGQEQCGLSPQMIEAVMKWLSFSIYNSGYSGHSQVIWYDENQSAFWIDDAIRVGLQRGGPIVLYQCGMKAVPQPTGYYWRILPEHPSMRLYQLEVQES